MHKQVSVHSKFWSKFSRKPLSGISDQNPPPPPHSGKLQIWDDIYSGIILEKLQIWDDQIYSPPPFWKTSDLGWPKFTPEYPPPHFFRFESKFTPEYPPPPFRKNFRFGMTLRNNPPPILEKLQIWDDQSLLRNTPPPISEKLQIWDDQSLLTPPPFRKNFRFGMTKVYSGITPPPPHFGKTSDLGWPKFTPE